MIVECKDWSDVVGKSVVDGLVGIRAQIGADAAAIVTTEGFTAGALRVAVDEDIALIRLRPFDPNDGRVFITSTRLDLAMWGASIEKVTVDVPEAAENELGTTSGFPAEIHFVSQDGALIQSLESVMRRHPYPMEEGEFPQVVEFDEDRYLQLAPDHLVPVTGVSWTWRVGVTMHTQMNEFEGEGMLVFEQLDDQGEVHDGRMIVSYDRMLWTGLKKEGRTFPVAEDRCRRKPAGRHAMEDVGRLPSGEDHEVAVSLDELAREGARRMIAAALEAEVGEYVDRFVGERDEDDKRLVVRNGRARERKLTVGSGTVPRLPLTHQITLTTEAAHAA